MQTFRLKQSICTLLTIIVLLLATACNTTTQQETLPLTPSVTIQAYRHKNLQTIFTTHNYSWNNLDQGVPPLILEKFPDDLHRIPSTQQKKELFFGAILPMAMLANEEIKYQRKTIKSIFIDFDQKGYITVQQQKKIDEITEKYRIKEDPLNSQSIREKVLLRVNTLPESLVLAQAANESGWGTSRFARQANNIFGEWTFTPGKGIVPQNRPEGEIYEVRRFSSLYQSVRSYMRNINTHRAYIKLRQMREQLRKNNQERSGLKLALGLDNYSTRRKAYSQEIQTLIKSNRLEQVIASTYLKSDALIPVRVEPKSKVGLFSSKEALKNK
jgi:Bax protein